MERDFMAFVPPLVSCDSSNVSYDLEGPELISLDNINAEFARLEGKIRNQKG